MQFWRSWFFLHWIYKILVLKLLKQIEIESLFEKKVSPEVVHLDAEIAVWTSLLKIIGRILRNSVPSEEDKIKNQIIWSNNHFPQLFFYQLRPIFDNTAESFPFKIQRKQQKWKFPQENHLHEIVILEGNKSFLTIVPGNVW